VIGFRSQGFFLLQSESQPNPGAVQYLHMNSAQESSRMETTRATDLEISLSKIDDAVLALLLLGLHEDRRVWKTHDWDALDRLHKKGLISNPASKAKSVILSEEGLHEAERLFQKLFAVAQP
jgi:hypothetical protein